MNNNTATDKLTKSTLSKLAELDAIASYALYAKDWDRYDEVTSEINEVKAAYKEMSHCDRGSNDLSTLSPSQNR
jgi:hypothetical protein